MIEVDRRAGAARPTGASVATREPTRRSSRAGSASRTASRCSKADGVGQRRRQHGHWGKKPSEVDQEITAFEPEHRLAWRHLAERLDGKPAPRFAASTDFSIELTPHLLVRGFACVQRRSRPAERAGW